MMKWTMLMTRIVILSIINCYDHSCVLYCPMLQLKVYCASVKSLQLTKPDQESQLFLISSECSKLRFWAGEKQQSCLGGDKKGIPKDRPQLTTENVCEMSKTQNWEPCNFRAIPLSELLAIWIGPSLQKFSWSCIWINFAPNFGENLFCWSNGLTMNGMGGHQDACLPSVNQSQFITFFRLSGLDKIIVSPKEPVSAMFTST